MKSLRTAVRGRWTVVPGADYPEALTGMTVVVEGDTIIDVTREHVERVDRVITVDEGIVVAGFINLHNHALNGPTLKGIVDDYDRESSGGSLIYSLLMPMGSLSTRDTSQEDIRAIYRLGLLEVMLGGATTCLDMWRPEHAAFLDIATEMGLRAYGSPYVMSHPTLGLDSNGETIYGRSDPKAELAEFERIFRQYDSGPSSRIQVVLGPHGTDTCNPQILKQVRRVADELGCLITVHAAQSESESAKIRARHDMSPIEYLQSNGLVGPDVIAAHCVFASDSELDILRDTQTSVASCPMTFARGGLTAAYERFESHGINTGFGTDGYAFDMISEARAGGLVSKLRIGSNSATTAQKLLRAATVNGAKALGRSDLGRIEAGARADLLVVDMKDARLQPVKHPIETLMWYASAPDISTVIIDGEVKVLEGRPVDINVKAVTDAGVLAVERLWSRAERAGIVL